MSSPAPPEALVVGCGVIGLTSAIRLQEAGYRVRIVAEAMPPETTSAVAAAVWYPYRAYPLERVLAWSARTLAVHYELAADPATGCLITDLLEYFVDPTPDPWWREAVRRFRHATRAERPDGYRDGYRVEVPVVETPVHLAYLLRRFEAGGGTVARRSVRALAPLLDEAPLVVNCTGLGAAALLGDDALTPIRGQVVRVSNPGLRTCLIEEHGPLAMTYIIPRTHDCILGGTADEGDWRREPDPATTGAILDRACRLEPRLREARVLDVRVGLRPGRTAVRLEAEAAGAGRALIHNYGHGGAGYTLCWGCADEVVDLARRLVRIPSA